MGYNNFYRISGCSAAGSAPALGAGCRGFKSLHSDQNPSEIDDFRGVFLFFGYRGAGGEPVILNIFFVKFRLVVVIFAVLYYNKCGNIGEGAWYERKQIPKMVADYSIFFTSLFPYTIRCFCLNNFKLVSQFFIRLFQKDFGVILIALNHPDLFSVDIQRD